MIEFFLYLNATLIISMLILVIFSKTPWAKVLSVRLLFTCIIIEIVLFGLFKELNTALDIAITFAILGFVDIQFLSVFLRKKGDL